MRLELWLVDGGPEQLMAPLEVRDDLTIEQAGQALAMLLTGSLEALLKLRATLPIK